MYSYNSYLSSATAGERLFCIFNVAGFTKLWLYKKVVFDILSFLL